MTGITRSQVAEVRGAGRLLFDASAGIVDVVERMHRTIERRPGAVGEAVLEPTRGITGLVYRSVRGSMRLLGQGLEATLAPWERLLPQGESTPAREVFVSVLNGLYGDHLVATGNPLAIAMQLRHDGVEIDPANPAAHFASRNLPAPTHRLLVLVHGLCMSDHQWQHEGFGHGAALADELGYTPVYVRYNSGLPIAENGGRLAELLETLVAHWPCRVDEVTLLGHSMGGLVTRSACHAASGLHHAWPERLRALVFLGTPHHGAPLERGSAGLDTLLRVSPYSAPFTRLGQVRSAGIRDLRRGTITAGEHRFVPLPAGTDCYAVAATLGARRNVLGDHLLGDGLVPIDSALGRHRTRGATLRFPPAHQWIGYDMGHLELLHRPEVYARLAAWLGAGQK